MSAHFDHLDFPNYGAYLARTDRVRRGLLHRILPVHVYDTLKSEARLACVRLRAPLVRRRFLRSRDLLVNVGAGRHGRPGWVNVDPFPAGGVNCVYDCRKSLPFPDGSVRGIFAEHFFEHIDHTEEAPAFLSECARVLEPAGVLRLIVPDAGAYLRAYCEEGWDGLRKLRGLGPGNEDGFSKNRYVTKMELINHIFRQAYEHKFAYDFETLAFALKSFGFADVVLQSFGQSLLPELILDQERRAAESLYVDARKEA